MKNKLGQGLAVGLTALAAAIVSVAAIINHSPMEIHTVMGAPVGVALAIMFGSGWEPEE